MIQYSCYLSFEGLPVRSVSITAKADVQACAFAAAVLRDLDACDLADVYDGDRRVCTINSDGWGSILLSEDEDVAAAARAVLDDGASADRPGIDDVAPSEHHGVPA